MHTICPPQSNQTHRSLRGSSKDSADSCIGAEAAAIVSAIATSAMDPLRRDAASPLADYGDPVLLQDYAVAVFSCVEGILVIPLICVSLLCSVSSVPPCVASGVSITNDEGTYIANSSLSTMMTVNAYPHTDERLHSCRVQ